MMSLDKLTMTKKDDNGYTANGIRKRWGDTGKE